jgi:hypothetical protein
MSVSLTSADEQICNLIRNHFSYLRQRQRQGIDPSTVTADVHFALKFVNDSVSHPATVLLTLGVINLRRQIAFNFTAFQSTIVLARTRIVTGLHRDGWKDADQSALALVRPIVGESQIKNWSCMVPPEDPEFTRDILQNARLIATEANLAAPERAAEPQPKPGGRSLFPLVSIEYERDFFTEQFTLPPAANPARVMVLVHFGTVQLRPGRAKAEGETDSLQAGILDGQAD